MKKFKNFALTFLFLNFIFSTLTGCTKVETNTTDIDDDTASDLDTETINQTVETFLIVDQDKCIGCRHCVKFDSEHFMMDSSTNKAQVISQDNYDSSDLEKAISRCPVDAITL